ncbi:uncharacterized protein NECHADRAFT_89544 [Fusarium vanettenii 77-13-4]|uniref:Alpha/beta hydrolase fold-3 domain-containing protein n=1 Tax=Fusarium vanettenii (strain ATCC MYA-4622 / CBS 123669 / FGSC 9596 / NRRL 45880 / 77-13-4) TaxID=660122 RepID=C7ZRI3_FUSV7|nr:uncharacterized protein NECHADRAFT_89544 [Fusarium vanettenii 77-13-4]EEU33374.1 hypothetical protein NECHADRAFT_89544 [Fusarium vanettenii 77-13-4]
MAQISFFRYLRLKLSLYSPSANGTPSLATKKPVVVNWHGSGFMLPSLGSDHDFYARIAKETGFVVLDADYRKGPEVESRHQEFDLERVAISGFSAGANLALVASSCLKDSYPALKIQVTVAIYPPVDLSIDPEAKTVPHPIRPIPAAVARIFDACYIPDDSLRSDPRISPTFADPALFPEAVVILTCSGDTLAPEGNAMATKLQNGKRRVINQTLEGVGHAFDKGVREGTHEWEQRALAYSTSITALKAGLGS